jgi:hypothetical protein
LGRSRGAQERRAEGGGGEEKRKTRTEARCAPLPYQKFGILALFYQISQKNGKISRKRELNFEDKQKKVAANIFLIYRGKGAKNPKCSTLLADAKPLHLFHRTD